MATPLPSTMRAVAQTSKTSTAITQVTVPTPVPTGTEHLIAVTATSPCRGELSWVMNFPQLFTNYRFPRIVAQDVSGTVAIAPPNSRFPVGTPVYTRVPAFRAGALADFTIVEQEELARAPESLGLVEAAAVPLSALTAWQGVFEHGGLDAAALRGDEEAKKRNAGVRVFVTGAGGAVGGWAVQFASRAGATVVAVAGGKAKGDAVRALGAAEVVDYKATTVDAWVAEDPAARECDLVLLMVGDEAMMRSCWSVVKDGGRYLSVTLDPNSVKPEGYAKTLKMAQWILVKEKGSDLEEITRLIDQGGVKPVLDSVVEFGQWQEAFDRVEGKGTNGKVIIKVAGSE